MRIAVVPNFTKEAAMACTEEITAILREHGCEVALKTDLFDSGGQFRENREASLAACDLFIAVGGDGTIIHTAKLAAIYDKPILGVNAGTLGFTAGLERDELSLLPRLLEGNYREERRLALAVELHAGEAVSSYLALNDAVVSGETASIVNYWMALGENKGYRTRADGFIVATPTGSTAYSLSAGGPVIQPELDCLVYTPVCAHSLFSRSVIFGGDTRLVVTLPENPRQVYFTVDGETPVELHAGDRLVFSRARRAARFIKLGRKDFYDVLNQKIVP